jgi:hypothetical protein
VLGFTPTLDQVRVATCLVLQKCKEKLGLSVPIPFECEKDETKCIEIATWNRRLNMIDGFCGFHISPQHPTHQCKFDISPSSTTWTCIKNASEALQVEQCVMYLLLTLLW